MTTQEIIEEIKLKYINKKLDESIENLVRLRNSWGYRRVAELVASSSEKLAIELYKKAEYCAKDFNDLLSLAQSICINLNDKIWAKDVCEKARLKAINFLNYLSLCEVIIQDLNEVDLAKQIYKEIERGFEYSYEFRYLAYSIIENLNDKVWVKELYQKAELLEMNE